MLELSEGEDVEATGGILWGGEVLGFEANVDACGEGWEDLKMSLEMGSETFSLAFKRFGE